MDVTEKKTTVHLITKILLNEFLKFCFKIIVTWLVSLGTVVGDKLRVTRATRNQREEGKGEKQRAREEKWEPPRGREGEGVNGRGPSRKKRERKMTLQKGKGRICRRRGKRNHRYIEMSKGRGKRV